MALNTVESLHLKILYNISTNEGNTGNYILVRHRPVAVSTFHENVGGAGEKKPELLSDPTRDHSVYVLDPLESLPGPISSDGPSHNSTQGISVGIGLLKAFMHQAWDEDDNDGDVNGDVSVTGRVITDRAVNSEVVEVIVNLKESVNRQAPFLSQQQQQPGSYYPMYNQSGVGITAYGSSPAHPPLNLCGTTTRRQQHPERRVRGNPVPPVGLSTSISGTAEKPIVLEDSDKTKEKAPLPQVPKFDDAALKEIATLLAQVDDPVQQATIMTILTAGGVPGVSSGGTSSNASLSAFSLIRTLSASLQKVTSPKPSGKSSFRAAASAPIESSFGDTQKQSVKKLQKENSRQLATFPPKQPFARKFTFKNTMPSSDSAVPPSSPTLAVRELAESYRQRGAARCAASVSKAALAQRVEPSSSDNLFKLSDRLGSSTATSRSSIAPGLALPGYRQTKGSSAPNQHSGSKVKRADASNENKDPSPKATHDQNGEKKRHREDSDQGPAAKKGRSALADTSPMPSVPPRSGTPPNPSTEVRPAFTPPIVSSPKTPKRNRPSSQIEVSLFTPSPTKTSSRSIPHQFTISNSQPIFPPTSSPLGGRDLGPGFFSPFIPNSKTMALAEPATPSGSSGLRSRLFEDSNVNLEWMDFAESDQQRLSVNRSSDPAEIADASATIAAANSSRWLGLPPSSPPPPTSPLQPSSDLDFMSVEPFKPDDSTSQEASTPNSDLGLDPASDFYPEPGAAVDPFEFFTSLGLSFPQETSDGSMPGPNFLVDGTDPQHMTQGMRELISGCVL